MRMWKYGLGCVEGVHNYMIGVIESYYDWWHIIMICISNKNICCTWCSVATYIMCTKIMGSSLICISYFLLFPHSCTARMGWMHSFTSSFTVKWGFTPYPWQLWWWFMLIPTVTCCFGSILHMFIHIIYVYVVYYDIMLIVTLKDIWTWACLHALMANQWQRYFFYEQIPLTAHSQLAVG